MDNQLSINVNNLGFHYSTVPMDDLAQFGASEYTVAQVIVDWSGSVDSFSKDLVNSLNMILDACKKHPRAENVLLRVVSFNSSFGVKEIHGFLPVNNIDANVYNTLGRAYGGTPLYDATAESLDSLYNYALDMVKNQFSCNAVTFIVTDGEENCSMKVTSTAPIKALISKLKQNDPLESFTSILVGINDASCRAYLIQFKDDCGIDEYKSIADATKGNLAKMAHFVSQSISTASVALNQGNSAQVSKTVASLSI